MVPVKQSKPVSNFEFAGIVRVQVLDGGDGSELQSLARLTLHFSDGQADQQVAIPVPNLDIFNWHGISGCRLNPEIPPNSAKRILADQIRAALPNAPLVRQYQLSELGTYVIESEAMFVSGGGDGGLIRPLAGTTSDFEVIVEPIPYSLDIDPALTEADAVCLMMELISLSPDPMRIVLAQTLAYIMRKLYETIGKAPCFAVMLYGRTGSFKTSIAALLTQMHNLVNGIDSPTRLNASIPAALEILKRKRDCVCVLDDLFPSESKQLRKQQESTLEEILRVVADNSGRARMGGGTVADHAPECGVLFTGEYPIGTGSNAARMLLVEQVRPDGQRLRYFQDNPLIISTFYHNFIGWFITHFDELGELLRKWRDVYDGADLGVEHKRLNETHYVLNTSYAILVQYLHDLGVVTTQQSGDMHGAFLELLSELVHAQDERANQSESGASYSLPDYLATIRAEYRNGGFDIADAPKLFDEFLHDSVLHRNNLNVRREKLEELFDGIAAVDDVLDVLESQNALKRGTDRREVQIYATGGKRFYAIPLKVL